MKKRLSLAALGAAALTLAAHGGPVSHDSPKNPPPIPPPAPESPFSGSVTLGYDSDYVFRGYEIVAANGEAADHLVWGALDLNYALNESLLWNFNAWYASSASADYDELNLYTKLAYTTGPFTIGPSFRWYYYPRVSSPINHQYEAGLELSASPLENLSVGLGAFYEFEAGQWYFQADVNYTLAVSDRFSLVPGATVSFIDVSSGDFGLHESDFHHVTAYLRAPIAVSERVTFTPYIAANFPIGGQVDSWQDPIVYGGASLTVSF